MKIKLTLLISLLAVGLMAQVAKVTIDSPGATGMNSNTDIQEIRLTDSPLLQNVNTSRIPGLLQQRFPLRSIGDNNVPILAAFGYFDPITRMRQIVSVAKKQSTDSLIKGYQGTAVTYNTLSTDTMAVFLKFSNRFESGIDSVVKVGGFLGPPPFNFELFDRALFITSAGNVPLVYFPYGAKNTSRLTEADTAFYKPHVFSMGLEAPGQVRAGVLNASGVLFGTYRWSSLQGLPSRWVTLDSQKAFITLFEAPSLESPDFTGDTSEFQVLLYRQKFGDAWYKLDTFTMKVNQATVYIDNNADGFSYTPGAPTINFIDSDEPVRITVSGSHTTPGALLTNRAKDTTSAGAARVDWQIQNRSAFDSIYYLAYSYYDPISGVESPLGPITKTGGGGLTGISDTTLQTPGDTLCVAFSKGYTKIEERAPWIRVYHGVKNDSMVWYGFAQVRANRCWPNDSTQTVQYTLFPGAVHDSMLTAGQPTQKISSSGSDPYKQYAIFQEDDGTAFVRPPYIEQLDIGFTDIAYANGRFWGIGDPLYPNRVYYSHYNDPYQWTAINYFSINENEADGLVSIEIIPEQGADFARIVLFKHNSMYELSGYDPEYDLTWRTVDAKIGAVSNHTVVTFGNEIYFLAPDMRVYEYAGGKPQEISLPIENYIDTLFTDDETARKKAVMYAMQDKIVLSDTANSRALVYVPRNNWWTLETYPSDFEPIGSFQYDTTRTSVATGQFDYWIYQGGAGEKFVVEFEPPTSGYVIDTINGSTNNYLSRYRTPPIGDGEHLFQIQKVDMVGRFGGAGKVRIINGFGVQLDSALIDDTTTPSFRMRTIGLPAHADTYLSLEFQDFTFAQRYEIHKVTVYYRRLGRIGAN